MVEVLSAGLTGANRSPHASLLGDDAGGPPRLGQTIIAIRPDGLGQSGFTAHLNAPPAEMTQQDGTRVPGDRRHAIRQQTEADGVELDDALAGTLRALGVLI